MWIGCASPVVLTMSHSSTVLSLGLSIGVVRHLELLTRCSAPEVDEQVSPLCGSQQQRAQPDGGVEQAAVATDLVDGRSRGHAQVVEAGVGAVENTEPVDATGDVEIREG